MFHLKKILIIFVFIFIIKTNFGIGNAFLGDDLGLNLYKNIDSGIIELEGNEYSYELRGQEKGGLIEDPINKILRKKGYGNCSISQNLSEDDINKISSGDLKLLSTKISPECSESGKSFSISTINALQSEINNYQINIQERAIEKAKQTYNISRIGLYQDGDLRNSPFDIIQDIKEIDTIIFTQPIEYEGETPINDGGFSDYLTGKYKDVENKLNNNIKNDGLIENINNTIGNFLGTSETEEIDEVNISEAQEGVKNNINPIPIAVFGVDNTQYSCINNIESSGLTKEYLDGLGIMSGGKEGTSDLSVLIPGINDNYDENTNSEANFIEVLDKEIFHLQSDYSSVNDNSVWDCSNFFCITVDFITSSHSLFGGEKMNSIQSIVEKSNEHLKKFVNTSLIQSKMTTNNFELGLRNVKLSEIFSFGMVITKKTPPILNIEKSTENSIDEDPFLAKNIYCKRWESNGGKCTRKNDLEIFIDSDGEAKSIIDSGELNIVDAAQKFSERKAQQKNQSLRDSFISQAIQRNAGLKETEELSIEFLEIERFVGNILDYSNNLHSLVKVMNKIPSNP